MKRLTLAIFAIFVTPPLTYLALTWPPLNLEAQSSRSSLLYTFHREAESYGGCDFTVIKLADGTVVGTCFCQRGFDDGPKCGISVSR